MQDLKILPEELRKNGFDYKLVKREKNKCIYSQSKHGLIMAYEIFMTKIIPYREEIIRLQKMTGSKKNVQELNEYREVFPSDEEFGKRAWTYHSWDKAMESYHKLI